MEMAPSREVEASSFQHNQKRFIQESELSRIILKIEIAHRFQMIESPDEKSFSKNSSDPKHRECSQYCTGSFKLL
jgi:hypothetical protein